MGVCVCVFVRFFPRLLTSKEHDLQNYFIATQMGFPYYNRARIGQYYTLISSFEAPFPRYRLLTYRIYCDTYFSVLTYFLYLFFSFYTTTLLFNETHYEPTSY